jgi:hypothetical protein
MNDDSFFSVDRLVEFGLGVSIASQMVKMMNDSIQQMRVPGADNGMNRSTDNIYYVIIDGNRIGPLSQVDLSEMIADKKIDSSTYVWKPGMMGWKMASEVPEVLKIVALTPPAFDK